MTKYNKYMKASQSAYDAAKDAATSLKHEYNKHVSPKKRLDMSDQEEIEFTVRGGPEHWEIATKNKKNGIKKGDRYLTTSRKFRTNDYITKYAREANVSPTTGLKMCRRTAYAINKYKPYKDDGTENRVPCFRKSVPYDKNDPLHRDAPLYRGSSPTRRKASPTKRTAGSLTKRDGTVDGRSKPGGNNPNGRNGSSPTKRKASPTKRTVTKPKASSPTKRTGSPTKRTVTKAGSPTKRTGPRLSMHDSPRLTKSGDIDRRFK